MAVITRWSELCVVASSDRRHTSASMRGHPRANWDGLAVITHRSELHVVVSSARERVSASRSDHPRANWDGLAVIARWSELHVVVSVLKDVEVIEIIAHWVRCVQCCDGGLGTRGRVTDQSPRDHRRSRRQFARNLRCVLGEGLSQVGSVATCAFANLVQVGTSSCVARCKCSRQGGVARRFSSLVGLGRAERPCPGNPDRVSRCAMPPKVTRHLYNCTCS